MSRDLCSCIPIRVDGQAKRAVHGEEVGCAKAVLLADAFRADRAHFHCGIALLAPKLSRGRFQFRAASAVVSFAAPVGAAPPCCWVHAACFGRERTSRPQPATPGRASSVEKTNPEEVT